MSLEFPTLGITAIQCYFCGSPPGTPCTKQCDDDSVPNEKIIRMWCVTCMKQLVPEFDAYYGKDEDLGEMCAPCRNVRMKEYEP